MDRNQFLFPITNKQEVIVEITSCLCVLGSEPAMEFLPFSEEPSILVYSSLLVMEISEFFTQQTVLMGRGWVIRREEGVREGLVGFSNLMIAQRCQNFTAVQVKCGGSSPR